MGESSSDEEEETKSEEDDDSLLMTMKQGGSLPKVGDDDQTELASPEKEDQPRSLRYEIAEDLECEEGEVQKPVDPTETIAENSVVPTATEVEVVMEQENSQTESTEPTTIVNQTEESEQIPQNKFYLFEKLLSFLE